MAEFKLGRIRFIWKGSWNASTTYYKDDIVRNGGNTYVCIEGHTSTLDFAIDFTAYWNNLSAGQEWKDAWTVSTFYKINDVVKYGGNLYIANTAHTSAANLTAGLELDISKWDQYAEGFDYRAAWATENRYKVNDIVKYNSTVYICIEAHTSAATVADGLEADQAKWNIFSKGIEWRSSWAVDTRYIVNDVVKYGGKVYVCNEGHNSAATIADGLELDQSKWDEFHNGIEYRTDWSSNTRYRLNDVVKFGGGLWICTTAYTSTASFLTDESNWAQFVEGLEFEDSWSAGKSYQPGDFVTYGGYSYVSVTNNISSVPTENPSDWDLFTAGFRFVGEWGDDSSTQDYRTGDVVTVGGYTYLCIADSNGNRPPNPTYWERLNSGIYWKDAWTDAAFYDLGDAVRFGDNSYICVLSHLADETVAQNRPDQDVSGTNWNILAAGAENNVMTTNGDLLYYAGAGPTRLPIGTVGQVLTVNTAGDAPEWRYLGAINNVLYVESINGVDEPAPMYGSTLDQPFKTIRYAAEQVEKGTLRPNARYLIEINKAFIQEETFEWVGAQITANTGIWTGFVNDNEFLTRVEFGKIIDALLWDLSHNGNVRTRNQTLTYFDSGALVTAMQDEDDQFIAAVNYLETVVDAVISSVDPALTYGSLTQTKNAANYPEEPDAQSVIGSLLDIITNALTIETTSSIPAEYKPNNSIFVKTGRFEEVLPIIIPENTAVIGDELRSTRIEPAGSLISITDVPYTIAGVQNLGSNINALLSGDNDGPGLSDGLSSFSSETVNTTLTIADSVVAAEASELTQQIVDYIDWGINGATGDSTQPVTTGSNIPNTAEDYTKAVEIIEKNRTYLVEEVIGYIAATYPSYVYNADKCRRDVNRYIDAIKHDLIYTGNYKSLMSARYYVNAVKGSKLEDMFYVRNGTGLRNCTVAGLDGRSDGNAQITNLDPELAIVGNEYTITTVGNTDWNAVAGTSAITYNQNDKIVIDTVASAGTTGTVNPTGLTGENANGTKRPLAGAFVSLDPGWGPNHTDAWIINKSPYVQNVSTFGTACVGSKVDGDLHAGGNDSIVANDFTQLISDGIGYWVTNLGRAELVSVFSYYAHIGYIAENGGKVRATNGNSSYGTFGTVAEGVDNTEVPITATVNNRSFDAVIQRVFTDGNNILTFEYLNAGVNYTGAGTTINIAGEGFGAAIDSEQTVNGGVFEVRMLDTDVNADGEGDFGGLGYITASNAAQGGNTTSITISNTDTALSSQYIGMAIFIISGRGAGQYGYIDTYNSGTKIATIVKASNGTAGWDHLVTGTAIESTLDGSTTYSIEPALKFQDPSANNPGAGGYNYATSAKARAVVEDNQIVRVLIWDTGVGYASAPAMTIVDPNNTIEAPVQVRIGDGVLTQPTWTNRGTSYTTAEAVVDGDGFADLYQPGQFLQVSNLSAEPIAGSNVVITGINRIFKLVTVRQLSGTGPFIAQLQLSPDIEIDEAPEQDDSIELRIRYSQVRLTGHDFLDIGTGNFEDSNYPNTPFIDPDPTRETFEAGGGRVFYTSTDQDGNFRVGELFSVEQATGIATLNADAFNISGLQELSLGELGLGTGGATITEFSTDGTFTANSDNIVPTQKAIKTYITSQIGGGAATLNVNSITAGIIQITSNNITTTTGGSININATLNLNGGVTGTPIAFNYYIGS